MAGACAAPATGSSAISAQSNRLLFMVSPGKHNGEQMCVERTHVRCANTRILGGTWSPSRDLHQRFRARTVGHPGIRSARARDDALASCRAHRVDARQRAPRTAHASTSRLRGATRTSLSLDGAHPRSWLRISLLAEPVFDRAARDGRAGNTRARTLQRRRARRRRDHLHRARRHQGHERCVPDGQHRPAIPRDRDLDGPRAARRVARRRSRSLSQTNELPEIHHQHDD